MILCHGCGQEFDPPAGYARTKIRCSACGVYCAVPADAIPAPGAARAVRPVPKIASEPAVEDRAAAMFSEPELAAGFAEVPNPLPTPKRNEVGSLELGEAPRAPADRDEDDAQYYFTGRELPTCPQCRKEMPLDSVFCAACGFNLQTRQKAVREYQPIVRAWNADMSLSTRLALLAGAEVVYLLTAAVAVWGGMEPEGLIAFWATFTALLCFILGTFERIVLTRDRKGRAKLVQQWRAFFVPLKPTTTEIRAFEGVSTGQWYDAGFLEWLVCIGLLLLGVIPAIVWWYNAIYKPHFHVALTQKHGHPEVYVYRGRSEEQMNDIADAVANASGLRRTA